MSETVTISEPGQRHLNLTRRTFWPDGSIDVSVSSSKISWTNTKTLQRGPSGWKEAIRNGQCATTNANGSRQKVDLADAHAFGARWDKSDKQATTVKFTVSGHTIFAGGSPSISLLEADYAKARNLSLERFYAAMASVESTFKGMTFTGELRDTLKMLKSPFASLRSGLGTYLGTVKKRARRTPRKKRLKMVTDTWLEWSFGVKPLINDCDNAVNAFYASRAIQPIFQMVRGNGSASSFEPIVDDAIHLQHNFLTFHGPTVDSIECFVKHYGVYAMSGNGQYPSGHQFGWSPWEFVPTLWELIPYSFLVDYFTNIGGILESWSYRQLGPRFVSEGVLRRSSRSVTCKLRLDLTETSSTGREGYGSGGSYYRTNESWERIDHVGTPIPGLSLKVPGNWHQWANMSALLLSARSVTAALTS